MMVLLVFHALKQPPYLTLQVLNVFHVQNYQSGIQQLDSVPRLVQMQQILQHIRELLVNCLNNLMNILCHVMNLIHFMMVLPVSNVHLSLMPHLKSVHNAQYYIIGTQTQDSAPTISQMQQILLVMI